jgi:1-acyl-sn-glycerol-3-phosphate acyltransferase
VDLYWVTKAVLGPVLRSLFRPWVRGAEHVPVTGGAILASNHLSFSDSIFLPLVLRRRVTFLAKNEYFTGTGLKGRLQRMFFTSVGQVPIDRSGAQASAPALDSGLRLLRRGQVLGLYPEGTRSPDGRLYRGKTGVARLALESRVPVLPVAMIGTDKVQPIGSRLPSIRRVGIIIGRPLDFSRYDGLADDRFVQRSVTDEIMYELMRLSGQEYVDEYASVVKERLAAERRQRVVTQVLGTVHDITGADTSRLSERLLGETHDGHRGATGAGPAPGPAPEAGTGRPGHQGEDGPAGAPKLPT